MVFLILYVDDTSLIRNDFEMSSKVKIYASSISYAEIIPKRRN